MAAISGTFAAAGASPAFTPTNGVSDVVISKRKGQVRLVCDPPVGTIQLVSKEVGAFDVLTPDVAITYQFIASPDANGEVDIDYYMGP